MNGKKRKRKEKKRRKKKGSAEEEGEEKRNNHWRALLNEGGLSSVPPARSPPTTANDISRDMILDELAHSDESRRIDLGLLMHACTDTGSYLKFPGDRSQSDAKKN